MTESKDHKSITKGEFDFQFDRRNTQNLDRSKYDSRYRLLQTPKQTSSILKWQNRDRHKISSLETQLSRFWSQRPTEQSLNQRSYPYRSPIKKGSVKFQPVAKLERQQDLSSVREQYQINKKMKPFKTEQSHYFVGAEQGKKNKSSGMSFQLARQESINYLQQLAGKLQTQISNLDQKLYTFNCKMNRVIQGEFKKLKQKIFDTIQKVFKESERHIVKYMKIQQEILASDILQIKQTLQKQFIKVEAMREQLTKPRWRKIVGELIANDIAQRIGQILKEANEMQVGHWQISQICYRKLDLLEAQLKQIVKISN